MSAPITGEILDLGGDAAPITWEDALAKAKAIGEPIIRAARQRNVREQEDNACNEILPILRRGPGAHRNSDAYRSFHQPLEAEGVEAAHPWLIVPPTSIPDKGYIEPDPEVNWRAASGTDEKFLSQWKKYEESPSCWPQLNSKGYNSYTLGSEPDENWDYTPQGFPTTVSNPPGYVQHDFGCNWHFSSTHSWNREGYLECFWKWLLKIPMQANVVNIYHKPFYDGTAVPDGGYSLMIQDIEHLPTPRDEKDEETRLHWHETSNSFILNMQCLEMENMGFRDLQFQALAEKKANKQFPLKGADWQTIEAFREMSNPARASAYLRPVKSSDVPALHRIFKWYAANSFVSPYEDPMSQSTVTEIVKRCRKDNLPFIVAVPPDDDKTDNIEDIVGFAYIRRVSELDVDKWTGELQVFVSPNATHKHIGWSLIHMILSIVDIKHPRGSPCYEWKPTLEVPYYQGSMHPMHTLLVVLSHPSNEDKSYDWLREWLQREFKFKEQGVLKGIRMKNSTWMDAHYLARIIRPSMESMVRESAS
ncbi:Acyl-CoA N-acyltransferase [Penicillium malachiteum]|uniref:Acyl-CoA N-acyltransferase n=1 Tax=Penicillium malachiteum TaxID=1324776 RepID=UPI00254771D2|nr:Acyl-CoA N-acyltransferase [Penicillium malachiteum]KAJ5725307.1 Acyl-CoA N-acyltransferase [Penicillium malachiteum]